MPQFHTSDSAGPSIIRIAYCNLPKGDDSSESCSTPRQIVWSQAKWMTTALATELKVTDVPQPHHPRV